ncbi:SDR family oxidoreductase [Sporolactobacillus shoreae]|uniref:SDR family oxidoreductase n=1 Tax=Sporolactobacillus shoreae TaxID=1465501 RepID=A0A4Z0GNP7_9BACL|nr:SDR family oxidoreductase [Sporolactobacillus shoreae]TGA98195.1 SDR family oxidoreductase [Sporolactobacillus shoreae]
MFKDSIIVITGASSGLGRETALLFSEKGALTILLARNREKLDGLKKEIEKSNGRSDCFCLDVGDTDQVASVFGKIIAKYQRIDVLINCAGFGKFEYVVSSKTDDIKNMFEVNVIGLIACTQAVLPQMISRGHGQIVNIASIAGKIATPKSAVYSASKNAVIGFSNGLRLEMEQNGVFVTVINPGPIRTPFFKVADPDGVYTANIGRFMLDARYVAERILEAVIRKKREINLPWYMGVGAWLYQLWPWAVEKISGRWFTLK